MTVSSFTEQMREQFTKLAEIEFEQVTPDQVAVRPTANGIVELAYKHDAGALADVSVHEKFAKLRHALEASGLQSSTKSATLRVTLPDTAESLEMLRIAKEKAAQFRLTEMARSTANDMQEMLVNAGTDPVEARRKVHGALTAVLPSVPRDSGVAAALSRRREAEEAREKGGAAK